MKNVYEIQLLMKPIRVMCKCDTYFNYVSDEAVIIYLPGYGGDKNELPFLREFFIKNKQLSFFSLSYSLQNLDKKNYSSKSIVSSLEKTVKTFLDNHKFKKCYLVGYSLGAAFALEIISRKIIKFDKLILISVFDDRRELLKDRGIKLNSRENISPISLIKNNKKTPIVFIHGAFDSSINLERALKVYNSSNRLNNRFILLPIKHNFDMSLSKKLLVEAIDDIL